MHCPGCGGESSVDQKFCRKCGFNLEPIGQLVKGQVEKIATDRAEQESRLVRRMFRWITWGCLVLLFGVVLLVLNRGFIHAGLLTPLTSLLILGGVVIAMYGLLSTMIRGTYLPAKTSKPDQIKPAKPTGELPEARIPAFIPSVTERTTQLIGEEAKRE